ncbi:hypothetical protein HGRIS_011655 [Hohenbuehelia grisea]|uniref:Carboxylic ester hydrolase n=1 Tax=Hohenbuehelia grisea TaxID=104357 RepID=A0ABR3JVS4_9AGAR
MVFLQLFVAALLSNAVQHSIAQPTHTPSPVVDLGYAKYQGFFHEASRVTNFLGVRYAQEPTGNLRWRAPTTPKKVVGIQPATSQPPRCFQGNTGQGVTAPSPINHRRAETLAISEDCLFLNVYTPGDIDSVKKPLPVVVWIHGGGYALGGATGFFGADTYDGNDLIREAGRGVVAVVIQYRLGLLGFLSSGQVNQNGDLNAGLLDQQFALQWIQTHIHKFGGDRNHVTIWGQSAGAGSVIQHMIANGGRTNPPLFKGGISSSSFIPSQYRFDDPIPEATFNKVVSQLNCTSSPDQLNCLRSLDADTLQLANSAVSAGAFFGTFNFAPVVDGRFIQQRPTVALQQKKINGDFFLAMTNTNEGALFVDANTADTVHVPTYIHNLFPALTQSQVSAAAAQYAPLGTPITQVNAIMSEAILICPSHYVLQAFNGKPAFKGHFAVPPAGHGNDLSYYFPSTNGPLSFNNTAFATAFSGVFLDFARFFNPNVKSGPTITPHWDSWTVSQRVEMLFNRTEAGAPDVREISSSQDQLRRCQFWESVSANTAQ